jgi:hypothetical protein
MSGIKQTWNERMDALKSLHKILISMVERKDYKKLSEENSKLIFDKVIEKFDDQHAKVQESALRLIDECFVLFKHTMNEGLTKLFNKVDLRKLKVVYSLVDNKENQRKLGKDLMEKIKHILSSRDITEQCLKAFHSFSNVTAQLMCLHVLGTSVQEYVSLHSKHESRGLSRHLSQKCDQ